MAGFQNGPPRVAMARLTSSYFPFSATVQNILNGLRKTPFKPTKFNMTCVHSGRYHLKAKLCCTRWLYPNVVPETLHEKNTLKAFIYVLSDVLRTVVVYKLGWMIDPFSRSLDFRLAPIVVTLADWSSWALYWLSGCQGVILAGWWWISHEAGHGARWVNHLIILIGFTPDTVRTYFSSWVVHHPTACLVHSRAIVFTEMIDPLRSPQLEGNNVHWTWRKLCASIAHRYGLPRESSAILRLPWYYRGDADL